MVRIVLALLLLVSTAGAQIELKPDREWYRPDTTKEGRVYRNSDRDFKVVMGDTTLSKVKPSFTLQAFSDQPIPASMKIHMMNTDPDSNWVRGDSFYVKNGLTTHRTYMKSETELEWEIILWEKPKTNIFTYDIETENLSFYYQDETTDVPGSYAVYHSSKKHNRIIINGNDTTYENYLTGKALQIPCPIVWDATSDTLLSTQVVDMVAGKMMIEVDSAQLASAAYPVTIDPTFGHTGVGASEINWAQDEAYGHILAAQQYTASTGDTITQYSIHGRRSGGSGGCDMVAYTFVSGAPNTRLTTPATITFLGGASAWQNSGAVTHGLSNGVTYVVCTGNKTGANDPYFSYDNVSNSISVQFSTTLGATWSDDFTYLYKVSMYATYEVVSAPTAAQVIPIRRH